MNKRINWKHLIIAVAIPLAVGALAALLTGQSMDSFSRLNQPPLSPPGWLFPVVWSILYTLMGVASYLVYESDCPPEKKRAAFGFYAAQLFFNFFWSILFFSWQLFLLAFFWLLALWLLMLTTAVLFSRCSKPAGWLFAPYLAWVAFAGYLNLAIYFLN